MASNIPRQHWLRIWRANILPHHKLLWWQAVNDCFPTRDRLHRYIPTITNLCPLCGTSEETVLHLFFMCDFAKLIWFGLPWCIQPDSVQLSSPAELFSFCWELDDRYHHGNVLLFASILMDLIWCSRNEFTHGGAAPAPALLSHRILKSYFDSVSYLSKPSPSVTSWIPPPSDWLKFYVDAAIGEEVSMIASVVHDDTGNIVFWHTEKI
ncbi:hypothetical protein UlMin_022536 [Ulmus minor]